MNKRQHQIAVAAWHRQPKLHEHAATLSAQVMQPTLLDKGTKDSGKYRNKHPACSYLTLRELVADSLPRYKMQRGWDDVGIFTRLLRTC